MGNTLGELEAMGVYLSIGGGCPVEHMPTPGEIGLARTRGVFLDRMVSKGLVEVHDGLAFPTENGRAALVAWAELTLSAVDFEDLLSQLVRARAFPSDGGYPMWHVPAVRSGTVRSTSYALAALGYLRVTRREHTPGILVDNVMMGDLIELGIERFTGEWLQQIRRLVGAKSFAASVREIVLSDTEEVLP